MLVKWFQLRDRFVTVGMMALVVWVFVCGAMAIIAATSGCAHGVQPLWSQAKPETVVTVNPVTRTVTLHNSKDVNVSLEGLTATGSEGQSLVIEKLVFTDEASSVRQANVAQLELVDRITRTAFESFGAAMGKILSEALMPVKGAAVTIDTPIGSGGITTGGGTGGDAPPVVEGGSGGALEDVTDETSDTPIP
jgi:hypothetical protein